jgi:hypothetical protein
MNWYKKANKYLDQLREETKKYKNPKDFAKDYEALYHGGSENIIGDKLSTGGRTVGEVTEKNLGKGTDYGGIFFTPERQLAETFKGHAPGGNGKVHTFLVKKKGLFDENNPRHAQMLRNFIGKNYVNMDGQTEQFNYQMYDFIFPKLEDGRRHMDWATFDPNILAAMGFEGAKVIEHYDAYGEGKHLYSTVLFTGGEKSPHWKIEEGQTPEQIYKMMQEKNELV